MLVGTTRACLRHAFRHVVVPSAPATPASLEVQDFSFSPLVWRPAEDELLVRSSFAALPRWTTPTATSAIQLLSAHHIPFYAPSPSSSPSTCVARDEAKTREVTRAAYVPGVSGSGAVLSAGRALPAASWLSQRVAYSTALARTRLFDGWCACRTAEEQARFACAHGACSSFLVVPASSTVCVPSSVTDAEAAVVMAHGLVAHYLVTDSYQVGPGSIIVVHAAAGGTGLLVCQMAKLRGAAMVIGICGGAEKAALAKTVGKADHVIDYKATPDWPAAVRALLPAGCKGVDALVVDADNMFDGFMASVTTVMHTDDGATPGAHTGVLLVHSECPVPDAVKCDASVRVPHVCVSLGDVVTALGPQTAQARLTTVMEEVEDKTLAVVVGGTWPLRKVTQAYEALAKTNGDVTGATLLNCVD